MFYSSFLFYLGAALGPAIGGILAGHIGVENSFLLAGSAFMIGMFLNQFLFTETLPKSQRKQANAIVQVIKDTKQEWKEIFQNKSARQLLLLNGT